MLKKVTTSEPTLRISLGLKQSTLDQLAEYRESYQATYGDEINQGLLIETMLREFMDGDKDFQKYLKDQRRAKEAERLVTSGGFSETHGSDAV